MTLAELKLSAIDGQHQVATLDPDGTLVESCHSLVDLSALVGTNVFESVSAFVGLGDVVGGLGPGDPVLQLPLAAIPEFGGDAHHDVSFRYQGEGEPILLLITDRAAANAALRAMQQERNETSISLDHALTKNGELRQYAHVVTHDLKAPLRAVGHLVNWIDEAVEAQEYETLSEYLGLLRSKTRKMEGIIEGILGYSLRSDLGRPQSMVDTHRLVQEIIEDVAPGNGTKVVVPAELPVIHGAPAAVRQVFANLISNAVTHGRAEGGTVSITVEHGPSFHTFKVSDDGPGIAHDRIDTIFGAADALPASRSHPGSGLGLSIVRSAVRDVGGAVEVRSTPGDGATFIVRWPRNERTRGPGPAGS